MVAKLNVFFVVVSEGLAGGYASLETDLPFVPSPGLELEHPVWHNGRKVESVSWNLEAGTMSVYLGEWTCTDRADLAQAIEMYRGHGRQVQSHLLD
jgi:hypothetical protein